MKEIILHLFFKDVIRQQEAAAKLCGALSAFVTVAEQSGRSSAAVSYAKDLVSDYKKKWLSKEGEE